jgi:hypothetical protein
MHGPEGTDYANESVFEKIIENELLVFNHVSPPVFRVKATFDNMDMNSTKLTFKMIFPDEEVYKKLRDFCAEKNEENFDRLETELNKMNNVDK